MIKILRTAFILGLLFAAFYTTARAQDKIDVTGPEDDPLALGYDLLHDFSALTGIALEDMSSGTTQLVGPNTDNSNSAVASTGFLFRFQDTSYTTFSVSGNGFVLLGPVSLTGNQNINSTPSSFDTRRLMPYWDDLCVGNTGKVHYKIVGAAPNKKLVIEWKNMKISRGGACDGSGNGTFQLWVSEHTGAIQFVYGDGMIESAAVDNGYSVGISGGGRGIASVTTASATCNFFSANDTQRTPIAAGTSYLFTPPMTETPTHGTVNPLGQSTLTLRWADNAFFETGYYIRRSTTGAEDSYIHLGTLPPNSTSFSDSGLTPGTRYYYIVNAITFYAVSQDLVFSPTTRPIATTTSSASGGLWSAPSTWSNGIVPDAEDVVQIAPGATVIIDTAAVAGNVLVGGEDAFGDPKSPGGSSPAVLRFGDAGPFSLVVAHNLNIGPNDAFSTGNGSGNQHVLTVGGDLINDGTFDLSTNNNLAGARLVFTGAANNVFSGTGPVTDIQTITINKGGSNANILELSPANFTVQGTTVDGPVSGWLFFQSGTFKISGTFSGTHRTFPAAAYQIPGVCGFWLDNPNYTVTPQNQNVVNLGKIRVTAGTYNIGTDFGNSLLYMLGSSLTIEGGNLNIAGRYSRSTTAGTSSSFYTQTGGTITVCKIGHSATDLACFEGSGPMTGGDVVIQNPGAQAAWDYAAGLSTENGTSGGSLHFGNALTAGAANFRGIGTFPNVHIDGTSGANRLTIPPPYNVKMASLKIDAGTKLVLSTILTISGNSIVNNGEIVTTSSFPDEIFFDGTFNDVEYSGTGTVTGFLYQLRLRCRTLTLGPEINNVRVRNVDIESGRLINSRKLTLGNNDNTSNDITFLAAVGSDAEPPVFDEAPVFDLGTGGQTLEYRGTVTGVARTIGPELNPSRTLIRLRNDDDGSLKINGGDLNLRALQMIRGRIVTGANKITSEFVSTSGGYVDGTLKWKISRTGEHLFPVGAGGYSYVTVNVTAFTSNSFLTITPVDATLPGLLPSASASRYWSIVEEGDTTGTLKFYYRDFDVRGTEANYVLWNSSGGAPTATSSTVDTFLHTVTSNAAIAGLTANWGIGAQLDPGPVSIGGSVLTSAGAGIRNAIVTISGGNLPAPVSVQTGQFGGYSFPGLQAGETYTVQAGAKRFRFAASSQQVIPAGNVANVNFVANPQEF